MKKNYMKPNEKVVELGTEANLLQGVLSGETTDENVDLEHTTGGTGLVKRESIWEDLW